MKEHLNAKKTVRLLAGLLAIVMVTCMTPISAIASYQKDFESETHTVFSHTESSLAPGVEQYINYAYSSDGKQMVYYVATADLNNKDVIVQTSYKDQYVNKQFGMTKLTEQIDFANDLYSDPNNTTQFISEYYSVVAGVNASFYNMTTGQPSGVCYLDGVAIGESASYNQYFAILKDGTAKIDYTTNMKKDDLWQAVAGSQMLVYEGKDVTANASGSYNTDRHSRTCVGITADNKVVFMVLDGRQEPFSCGGTMHELAQIMLEAGCTYAINLDGGGSTTYAARPEGENEVRVINRPSDGSERAISSGLIIATKVPPSDKFDHVAMTVADDYVTPGTSTTVSVVGVSPAGTSAEIPENIVYTATNGTIENGVFTADDTEGTAVITATVDGKDVGTTMVNVVIPDKIAFSNSTITVPYGKTVPLPMTATLGINVVAMKADDISFTLDDDSIGRVKGFDFTAVEEGESETTETTVTAVFNGHEDLTAEATIVLGKGSEVLFDFEDGEDSGFYLDYSAFGYYLPRSNVSVVTNETGLVHNGEYALAVNIDYSNSLESGYQMTALRFIGEDIYREGATSIGMWIYVPDECLSLWARWTNVNIASVNEDGTYTMGSATGQDIAGSSTNGQTGWVYTIDESGWYYLSIDVSSYAGVGLKSKECLVQFYISDRGGNGFAGTKESGEFSNLNGNYTFYIDDITVDYSSAVDDREAPIFSELNYSTEAMSDAATIAKRTVPTVKNDHIKFSAKVAENTTKANATGINSASAKAYIDGNEVVCIYNNGIVSMIDEAVLANGRHTIKFSICDEQGNYASIIRQINIAVETSVASTVKVVAHDKNADRVKLGSINYIDVVAEKIQTVQSVVVRMDLDNMSIWELDHMEVTDGFTAKWYFASAADKAENIATVEITRTGSSALTGEEALVSIPVRMWTLENSEKKNPTSNKAWTLAEFKAAQEVWPIAITIEVDMGLVTYTNGTSSTFTGEGVKIWSEMWACYAYMVGVLGDSAYWNSWTPHTHDPKVIENADATCTEDGYTNRTYCEGCHSVVDWGTTIPATGHNYEVVDGVLKCTVCDTPFNGVDEDGIYYIDGVMANGIIEGRYYVDGVDQNYTGIKAVNGVYYDFDNGAAIYTGMFYDDTVSAYRYAKMGELVNGWFEIDGEWHYFIYGAKVAAVGFYTIGSVTYEFDETGRVLHGEWVVTAEGVRYSYGPSYYRASNKATIAFYEIDGETYGFNTSGYRVVGVTVAHVSNGPNTAYQFDEEGRYIGVYTGLYNSSYYVEGMLQFGAGLIKIDDAYYYIKSDGAIYTGKFYVTEEKANGLVEPGTYEFGADGKMILSGIILDGYYYEDSTIAKDKGLVKVGDDCYYIGEDGSFCTGTIDVTEDKTNGLTAPGTYEFGEDGKMFMDGIIVGGYYYENNVIAKGKGLVQIGTDYYYIKADGSIYIGMFYVTKEKANGLVEPDTYEFGADGKMIVSGIILDGYYYENDEIVKGKGMVKVGGAYYYIMMDGHIFTGAVYVTEEKANDLLRSGIYEFGVDGKMIKNGVIVGGYYYENDAIAKGKGLVKVGDDYYYIKADGTLYIGKFYVTEEKANGLVATGTYEFAADGRMIINGVIGGYYYENSIIVKGLGLVRIGDDYYYVKMDGSVYVGVFYVTEEMANGLMNSGTYEFGADGKMILKNGIVDGYYYVDNAVVKGVGLVQVDGDYYYIKGDGACYVGTFYVTAEKANGLVEPGVYVFGEDGKMITE